MKSLILILTFILSTSVYAGVCLPAYISIEAPVVNGADIIKSPLELDKVICTQSNGTMIIYSDMIECNQKCSNF